MVQHRDVEQAPGGDRLGGEVEVIRTRVDVARWVVVDEDQGRRVAADRFAEQLAHPDEGARDVALVDPLLRDDAGLRVQQQDVELLTFEAPELDDQPLSDVAWTSGQPAGADRRELESATAMWTRCRGCRPVAVESDEPWRPVAGSPVDPLAVGR